MILNTDNLNLKKKDFYFQQLLQRNWIESENGGINIVLDTNLCNINTICLFHSIKFSCWH